MLTLDDLTYGRVSTDSQEKFGSFLESQLSACLELCRQKGCNNPVNIQEAYSGLTLDRPKLTEMRQMVARNEVRSITCYCPDRLSRVGEHLLQLMNEFSEHGVSLRFVHEDWSGFDPATAKLLAFIYGWSSEQEARKILERTSRGKKSRALSGKLPSGGYCLYGYVYDKTSGHYIINEYEAQTVRNIFNWLVIDQISMREICRKLNSMGIAAPKGGKWGRSTIGRIFKNTEYYGSTFAYKTIKTKGKRIFRDRKDWIELPAAVPPIISQELFNQAQQQLKNNQFSGPINHINNYLLKGMIFCGKCGARYNGTPTHGKRYYRCSSHSEVKGEYCHNRIVNVDWIEGQIWRQVKANIKDRDKLIKRYNEKIQSGEQLRMWQATIDINNERIRRLEKRKDQTIEVYTSMEDMNLDECKAKVQKIKQEIDTLKADNAQIELKRQENQQLVFTRDKLQGCLDLITTDIEADNLDFEYKRKLLQYLRIRVVVGDTIEVKGFIAAVPIILNQQNIENVATLTTTLPCCGQNPDYGVPFSFELTR